MERIREGLILFLLLVLGFIGRFIRIDFFVVLYFSKIKYFFDFGFFKFLFLGKIFFWGKRLYKIIGY